MSDSNERVLVYANNQVHLVEMLKHYLSDNGIHAFAIDKRDSSYILGEIELLGLRYDVLRAKSLIKKFEES